MSIEQTVQSGSAPVAAAPAPAAGGQIADLSYRHYDGPLRTRMFRWWTIAASTFSMNAKKKPVWFCVVVGGLIYLVGGAIFYFSNKADMTSMSHNPGGQQILMLSYGQVFHYCLKIHTFFLFVVALIAGAGSIAADHHANALLVYLSKPLTKGDYLLGKWIGVFLVVFAVSFIPALLLYIFMLCTYWDGGFLTAEPGLILRMTLATAIPAVLHSSVSLGVSACCKNTRTALGAYAAFYFLLGALVFIASMIIEHSPAQASPKLMTLMYLSLDGITSALTLPLYHIQNSGFDPGLPRPELMPIIAVAVVFFVLPILVARARIRAVEVVKG